MAAQDLDKSLERQITEWRAYLRRRQAIEAVDVAELEDHLREQIAVLMDAGLDADEAFLVAVKRMGELDALSREFAREHSERLWKQLVLPSVHTVEAGNRARTEALTVVGLAVGAALAVKLPELFRITLDGNPGFYARNLSLFAFPFLIAYFLWKRGVAKALLPWEVAALVAAVLLANAYPYTPGGHTELLVAIHLPIALWLMVGRAYAASRWNDGAGRMDFVRFSGELVIYYALIALGGGVLSALTALTFRSIGLDIEDFLTTWLLPCGAMGAVIVGAWLAEAKQSVIENMAPVLARVRRGSRRRMLPIPVHKISTIHPRALYTRKRASMGIVCPAGPVNGSKWIISQPEGLEPHVTSCCTMMSRRCWGWRRTCSSS
jgi:hypothetical protein